jgi:phage gp29-like protein
MLSWFTPSTVKSMSRSVTARAVDLSSGRQSAVQTIVVPSARQRWGSLLARNQTPESVAGILSGAMTGNYASLWALFDLMEDTWPRLLKNLSEVKRAVCRQDWTVTSWAEEGQPATPDAEARAKMVSHALWTMKPKPQADENGLESTLFDLMDAWGKGVSVLEIDWELRNSVDRGSMVAPRCTRWVDSRYWGRPDNSLELRLNANELNLSNPSIDARQQWMDFPENKFLIGICKAKTGPVVTSALLRPLAFWWCAANFSADWLLNLAQLFGQPIRWATYDDTKDGIFSKVCEMLENMGSAAWAAFPEGTTLELKEGVKTAGDNPQAYVMGLAEKNCDLLILGQTLTTDAGDRGTQALGTVHMSVRDDIIDAAKGWAARMVNEQLIPAIVRLNFGDEEMLPWISAEQEEQKDNVAMATRDKTLIEAGLPLPKQWLYERHKIPPPKDGEDVVEKSAPAPVVVPGALPGADNTGGQPLDKQGPQGTPGTPVTEETAPTPATTQATLAIMAKAAQEQLVDNVLAGLTGVPVIMQSVKSMPFLEALAKLGTKTVVGAGLDSEAWSKLPVALRERSFFSATIESARFLQRAKDSLGDFLAGAREVVGKDKDGNDITALKTGSRADFVHQMSSFAASEGMGPVDPNDVGTIKDIQSQKRLELIFNVQTQQAYDFGNFQQGQDPDILQEFPAQRFVREVGVSKPRDSHAPYEGAVALKTDIDFWVRINEDFGVPYGPWGWGCGHGVEDVDRDEAESLGLIKPGQILEPATQALNDKLQSSLTGLDPDTAALAEKAFGDRVTVKGDSLHWKGSEPDQP